jgi:hypothetical protein
MLSSATEVRTGQGRTPVGGKRLRYGQSVYCMRQVRLPKTPWAV